LAVADVGNTAFTGTPSTPATLTRRFAFPYTAVDAMYRPVKGSGMLTE
jgi:hypothetical protein